SQAYRGPQPRRTKLHSHNRHDPSRGAAAFISPARQCGVANRNMLSPARGDTHSRGRTSDGDWLKERPSRFSPQRHRVTEPTNHLGMTVVASSIFVPRQATRTHLSSTNCRKRISPRNEN